MRLTLLDDLKDDMEAVLGHLIDLVDLLSQCIIVSSVASPPGGPTACPFDSLRQSLANYANKTQEALKTADDYAVTHPVTYSSVSALIKLSGLSASVVMLIDLVNKFVADPQFSADYTAVRGSLIAACKGRGDLTEFPAISANLKLPELGRQILACHQVALSWVYVASFSEWPLLVEKYRQARERLHASLLPNGAKWRENLEMNLKLLADILMNLPAYSSAAKAKNAGIGEAELLSRGDTSSDAQRANSFIILKMWCGISVIPSFQFDPSGDALKLTRQVATILRVTESGERAESTAPYHVEQNGFDGWPLALWAWNHQGDEPKEIKRRLSGTSYWRHSKYRRSCHHAPTDGVALCCTGWNASGVNPARRDLANAAVSRASASAQVKEYAPRAWFNMSPAYCLDKGTRNAKPSSPFYFGQARPASRFELPKLANGNGTMYLANSALGCLGEVLAHRPIMMLRELQEYVVRKLECTKPLHMMDLREILPYDSLCDADRVVTHAIAHDNNEAGNDGILYSLRRVIGGTGLALFAPRDDHPDCAGWEVPPDSLTQLLEEYDFWRRIDVAPETLPDMLLLPYPK